MTDSTTTIAGEPLETLLAALRSLEVRGGPDGWAEVSFRLKPEVGASFQRAVERYAAHCLHADTFEPIERRMAFALMRLATDVDAALNDPCGGM